MDDSQAEGVNNRIKELAVAIQASAEKIDEAIFVVFKEHLQIREACAEIRSIGASPMQEFGYHPLGESVVFGLIKEAAMAQIPDVFGKLLWEQLSRRKLLTEDLGLAAEAYLIGRQEVA